MNDMAVDPADENSFVSVPDAARRLGIPDRTAQRYAAKLSENDRQVADNGSRLVRLSAMVALTTLRRGVRHVADTYPGNGGQNEAVADNGGHDDRVARETAENALIEQLRGEVTYLRAALEREQETARAALTELTEQRKREAVLIAAAATGRLQIEPSSMVETVADTPADSGGQNERSGGHVADTKAEEKSSISLPQAPLNPEIISERPSRWWWPFGKRTQ